MFLLRTACTGSVRRLGSICSCSILPGLEVPGVQAVFVPAPYCLDGKCLAFRQYLFLPRTAWTGRTSHSGSRFGLTPTRNQVFQENRFWSFRQQKTGRTGRPVLPVFPVISLFLFFRFYSPARADYPTHSSTAVSVTAASAGSSVSNLMVSLLP